jgi:hypothetical protein
MEIVPLRPELHLIKPAFGQTYLWRDGSELTLVDTGIPGSAADLAAAFAELGTDRALARESFARLAQVPAEVVCFGHGDPLTDSDGAAAWRALGERCQGGPGAVPDPLG